MLFNTESQKIADIKAQEADAKRKQEEADANKLRIEKETLAKAKDNLRESRMRTLMFKKNEVDKKFVYTLGETIIEASFETVLNTTEEQFDAATVLWEKQIHIAYEKKVDKDAELAKQQARADVQKEQADKVKAEAEAKAKADMEIRQKAEEEAKKKAALPDKEKLLAFVKSLDGIQYPTDVSSEKGKRIVAYASQLF